jgi:hypothetical protein
VSERTVNPVSRETDDERETKATEQEEEGAPEPETDGPDATAEPAAKESQTGAQSLVSTRCSTRTSTT